jgi:exopolyphosphatase/guanosine-5'-triphosphate,3'-diphosphate pyrophosphatase
VRHIETGETGLVKETKIAVIDIGSNSVRLLLGTMAQGRLCVTAKKMNTTRVAEGVDATGVLTQKAMQRTAQGYAAFVQEAKDWGALHIAAYATSAVRDAENGKDFVAALYNRTGVPVAILSGEEDADIAFAGAVETQAPTLVADVGGGSTEFSYGEGLRRSWGQSVPVGAVRATERFGTHDLVDKKMLQAMYDWTAGQLRPMAQAVPGKPKVCLGVGGIFSTIAAMAMEMAVYDSEKVQGYLLSRKTVTGFEEKLIGSTRLQREGWIGLQKARADVSPAGLVIVAAVMDVLALSIVTVSDRDGMEGYARKVFDF